MHYTLGEALQIVADTSFNEGAVTVTPASAPYSGLYTVTYPDLSPILDAYWDDEELQLDCRADVITRSRLFDVCEHLRTPLHVINALSPAITTLEDDRQAVRFSYVTVEDSDDFPVGWLLVATEV